VVECNSSSVVVEPWNFMPIVVYIPGALHNLDEDETQ